MIYAKYDQAFALQCLNAAKSAWTYLEQNPNNIKSPNGPYNTDNDLSSRFWLPPPCIGLPVKQNITITLWQNT